MRQSKEVRSKIGGWPLAAAIAVILAFLFFIRSILPPFVLAAALAFVLTPAIDWADRRTRMPRWVLAVIVYLAVLGVFALVASIVAGSLLQDGSKIATELPELVKRFTDELADLLGPSVAQSVDAAGIARSVQSGLQGLLTSASALTLARYGVSGILGGVLGLFVLAYFLISGRRIAAGIFWLVPPEYREEVRTVGSAILPVLWRYFVGLAAVVTYTSFAAWIVFGPVFHLPQSPLLAVMVGLLELIPLIGPALTLCIVGVVAAQQTSAVGMMSLFGFAIALRISIDQLVGPLVLGQAARLHPFVIIFAFLSGGVLFGVVGLLLAVPVAASIKIVLTAYYAEPVTGTAKSD